MKMKKDYELPGNRVFGALFVTIFTSLALWHGWYGAKIWLATWALVAVIVLFTTIFYPEWLTPFNRAWMAFGHLLGRIVSPVVLGFMYAVLFVPIGLVMKLKGRDAMRREYSQQASYWIEREDGEFKKDSFKNQF